MPGYSVSGGFGGSSDSRECSNSQLQSPNVNTFERAYSRARLNRLRSDQANHAIASAVLRIFLRPIRSTLRRTSPGASPEAQIGAVSFLHRLECQSAESRWC